MVEVDGQSSEGGPLGTVDSTFLCCFLIDPNRFYLSSRTCLLTDLSLFSDHVIRPGQIYEGLWKGISITGSTPATPERLTPERFITVKANVIKTANQNKRNITSNQ